MGHVHTDTSRENRSDIAPEAVDHALRWALWLNGGFLLVEGAAGWWTGSLALLSDAVHMVGDVSALALAYTVRRLARWAATAERTYGLGGAETLGAFVNSLALLGACVFLIWEAVGRLGAPPASIAAWPVILVGLLGLLINLGSAWKLYQSDRENLNVRGALLHMLADALGSVGAVLAGVLVIWGYPLADPLIAMAIALLVIVSTSQLLRETGRVLLQFTPKAHSAEQVLAALEELPGVANVHDLHVWSLNGQETILSAHLLARPGTANDRVLLAAQKVLRERFGILHTTLQTETDNGCESDCQVWSPGSGGVA
jgi:cobalt-zinc-cadmium efflux system protein